MKTRMSLNQQGVGHVGIIVVVVVLGLVGLSGWWVMKNQKKDNASDQISSAIRDLIKNAKCDYDDKDLCKFFTSWKANKNYIVNATQKNEGKTATMTIETQGDNSHIVTTGQIPFNVITIGKTTYTKAGDTWWKQTQTEAEAATDNVASQAESNYKFDEPTKEEATENYKKLGKEKCGSLTCFKYEVANTGTLNVKQYMWFDDKDYQLRRMQMVNADSSYNYDATFSYKDVDIKVPSPVKELGPNQYIVPGQNEPTTIPTTPSQADLDTLMQQYRQ